MGMSTSVIFLRAKVKIISDAREDLLTFVLPHESHDDKFIISLSRRVGVVTWPDVSKDIKDAKFELLHIFDADKPQNRLNDAKCDSNGRIWAGQ